MKRRICLILALVLLCGLTGCAVPPAEGEDATPTETDAGNRPAGTGADAPSDTGLTEETQPSETVKPDATPVETVSHTLIGNAFDDSFLSYISSRADGNYMVSPLSFRYALGLLIAGAAGETRTQLLNALGVSSVDEWAETCRVFNGFVERFDADVDRECARIDGEIAQGWLPADTPMPTRALRVADSVWKNEEITVDFRPEYTEYTVRNFGAESETFTKDNAVKKINAWAERKTEGLIKNLLPDDYDTEELAVALMNALYFKDSWVHAFPEYATSDRDFMTRNGNKVKKTFMEQTEDFLYYADGKTQLVILPMEGDVQMAYVLGDTENLGDKIAQATWQSVTVIVPKMDTETTFSNGELVDYLMQRGVTLAFDGDYADFSAMLDYPVYVSDIIQKTRIKTDEDGVEAAAVTYIGLNKVTSVPERKEPVVFCADRPFSYYIYTTVNGVTSVMFAGETVE